MSTDGCKYTIWIPSKTSKKGIIHVLTRHIFTFASKSGYMYIQKVGQLHEGLELMTTLYSLLLLVLRIHL